MALYADKILNLGCMTDERVAEYISHRSIQLDKWETAAYMYEREFKKQTPRVPSDVVVPLLNVEKQFVVKFFSREEDKQQIDKIYALLEDPAYAEVVQSCSGEFKVFDREILAKDFGEDA